MGLIVAIMLLAPCFMVGSIIVSFLQHDRARIGSENKPQWFTSLPPETQKIHLKELYNETASRFTAAWFLEYWHGKRSAFYAIITWCFIMPVVFYAISTFIYVIIQILYPTNGALIVYAYSLVIYLYFIPIIIYRCTNNSPPSWKYIIRIMLTLFIIFLTMLVCTFNIYTVFPYIASFF